MIGNFRLGNNRPRQNEYNQEYNVSSFIWSPHLTSQRSFPRPRQNEYNQEYNVSSFIWSPHLTSQRSSAPKSNAYCEGFIYILYNFVNFACEIFRCSDLKVRGPATSSSIKINNLTDYTDHVYIYSSHHS